MSKDAYYFSHDSNARNDPNILRLLQSHGWAGYGLFWALIEMLRDEPSYKLKTQYDVYAFALRTEENCIRSIIEDFGLFTIKNDFFYSASLLRRMKIKEDKSEKARQSALLRWSKNDANALRPQSECNAIKERKGKEKKRNITTLEYSENFLLFWEEYPNKQGKAKAFQDWQKMKCDNGLFSKIMEALKRFKGSHDWLKENGKFIPHGSTWVKGRRWEDKIENKQGDWQ